MGRRKELTLTEIIDELYGLSLEKTSGFSVKRNKSNVVIRNNYYWILALICYSIIFGFGLFYFISNPGWYTILELTVCFGLFILLTFRLINTYNKIEIDLVGRNLKIQHIDIIGRLLIRRKTYGFNEIKNIESAIINYSTEQSPVEFKVLRLRTHHDDIVTLFKLSSKCQASGEYVANLIKRIIK